MHRTVVTDAEQEERRLPVARRSVCEWSRHALSVRWARPLLPPCVARPQVPKECAVGG